jgi:hypothetical protein
VKLPGGSQRRRAGTDHERNGERDEEESAAGAPVVRSEGVESSRAGTGRCLPRRLRQASEAARNWRSSSVDIVHLVVGAQLFERTGKPGVDRTGGDSEELGDRGRCVAEPVAQDDNNAPLQGKSRYRVEQLVIAGRDVMPLEPSELGVTANEPPLGPKQVEAAVDDDPVKPGTEGPALVEARQRPEPRARTRPGRRRPRARVVP